MCTGYRGIFTTKPIGYLGGRRMDRQYMLDVEARARALRRACRPIRREGRTFESVMKEIEAEKGRIQQMLPGLKNPIQEKEKNEK